jgi:D-alanyl-D-alanine carboxypeptidase/D-alanyl-D-alanine-endopeptidase (penicillin-binding protein 4)
VAGDLVLDDALFDREYWHPDWGRTSSRAYHAPVGALTANYGSFSVTVSPGDKPGDPVRVVLDPPVPYLRLENQAVTAGTRGKTTLVVDRSAGEGVEIVRVAGALRLGTSPKPYYRSVLDPTRYAGAVLRRQLEAVGIEVEGKVRVGTGPAGSTAHELMVFEGRPLAEIVRLFVKFSNNAIAETLVKQIGLAAGAERGSWKSGMSAMRSRLVGLGVLSADSVLVDGSGLSYQNRVSPRVFVKALRLASGSFKFGPELIAALPIAAGDGTLEERAKASRGEVRAKTGLLNGVTSLSGFAQLSDGERAVFSLLVNGYRVSDDRAMNVVDRFAAELVRDARSPRAASMAD